MAKPASADFAAPNAMQGVMSMDVAQVADPGDTATSMDCCTDDLVSTLQVSMWSEVMSMRNLVQNVMFCNCCSFEIID